MALLVPDVGEQYMLKAITNNTAATNPILKLFKSNTTPAETDTNATYTVAAFTGYADVTLTGASWTFTAGAPSHADYAQQSFTSSANQTTENEYGYYVLATTSNTLLWAERFSDGPYPVTNNGDIIKVTPYIEMA